MKTKRKSIISLISALVILAALCCACYMHKSPADQVTANLERIKSEETSASLTNSLIKDADLSREYEDKFKQLIMKQQDFDYEIKEEAVDKESGTAVVTVTITTYDLGNAYRAAYDMAISDAAEGVIDEETDVDTYVYNTMFDLLLKSDTKDYVVDVDIHCEQNELGDWETDLETNEAFHDAWSGGLNSAIAEHS